MVQLHDEGDPTSLEAVDHRHLPQRTVAGQSYAGDVGHHLIELALASRGLGLGGAEMVGDVEVGVVDHHRIADVVGGGNDPASKHRHSAEPLLDQLGQIFGRQRFGPGRQVDHDDLHGVHVGVGGL